MKKFTLILGFVLALGAAQSLWAAEQGGYGAQQQVSPASGMPVGQGASDAPPEEIVPHDKNGKPMTDAEFAKAEEARMKSRTAATQKRLEARQARWKKNSEKAKQAAAKDAVVPEEAAVPQK